MPRISQQGIPIIRVAQAKPPPFVQPSTSGPVSAWADSSTVKMCLYGRSGSGKTTMWSTFPAPIRAYVCSGGNRPGELKSIDTAENRKRIDPRIIEESSQLVEDLRRLPSTIKTVVLDHGSGLQDLILKEVLGIEEIPVQKSWGLASMQQYGQVAIQWKEIVRAILNLDCNVVIVAQERSFGDEGGGSSDLIMPSVGAALMPNLTGWLNPACDYICHTFLKQKERITRTTVKGPNGKPIVEETVEKVKGADYCLRTAPDPIYMTKFRFPKGKLALPDYLTDPSYDKVAKLLAGG